MTACGSASMGGGIAGTSSVVGAISGFGSIVVAGIEFDTTNAQITIEGNPAAASDLRLGMVAAVRGAIVRRGQGVADLVAIEDLAEGPLEVVDVSGQRLGLLRQGVLFDAATVFDPEPLADLQPGDDVEVSGFLDANGDIRATRVERIFEDVEIELKGYIQSLDLEASTFGINDLIVDFAEAIIEAPSGLRNGLFVELEGDGPPEGNVLTAAGVEELDPTLMAEVGDGIKVEGFVTNVVSPTEVIVTNQRVQITPNTRFEGGSRSDLVLNAAVEVEGIAGPDGALIATEIEFSPGT
jgi:hypothetical protein